MNNTIAKRSPPTRKHLGISIILSIISIAFFLGACSANTPIEQFDESRSLSRSLSVDTKLSAIPLGSVSTFAVLGGTTVTNVGASVINGDLGVSPGTAITGFLASNTISGPGTVTPGLGLVTGTIYAGGPVAALAHNDAVKAFAYLNAQVPDTEFAGVTQLDGMTLSPGVYHFAPSANLQVNGTLTLDFQGNADAVFIFQSDTTIVTMAGSKVVAINNPSADCFGANVYWAVGSSATIDGDQFIGSIIAYTTITMAATTIVPEETNVSGRLIALNGAVTMASAKTISVCDGTSGGGTTPPPASCEDFVTGGGTIGKGRDKVTFGVSGGIKNSDFWGQLSFDNHQRNRVKIKSTEVTGYTVIDAVTRQIQGIAKLNNRGLVTYTVIVVDNGEPGRNDSFSLELSNEYSISGTLSGGNIKVHSDCEPSLSSDDGDDDDD